jgi:hypothetical protein
MPNPNIRPRVKKTQDTIEKNKVELLAEEIYNKTMSKIKESELYGIDPLTIIILVGIAVNIIRVIQECNKNKTTSLSKGEQSTFLSTDVRFRSFNHSFLTRMRLRKILKNHLTKDQYKVYGDVILQTLLEVGKTVKEEQVSALLEYENV